MTTAQPDEYFLGYRQAEQERLQRQAQELAGEARWLFDRVGLLAGQRAVEIGCGPQGCLDLLAERVGPAGTVVGVERSEESVRWARQFVACCNMANVEIIHGDGRSTGLPKGAFDLATARLVLVNVPHPEQIVGEMAALVRPGGVVALHEADWIGHLCEPPLVAWDELLRLLDTYSRLNGIDLFIGRKIPRMLREAGLTDVQVDPVVHVYPLGHGRRTILQDFAENLRDRLIEQKIIGTSEFNDLLNALRRHVEDPHTLVVSHLFFRAWGRRPNA
jgi:SAM-dependent methyltransferase